MLKKIALSLFLSTFLTSPLLAADLFDESYQEEQVRKEIERNVKKNEVISPEEAARVQNQIERKNNTKIKNMRPEQAKDFVTISNHILKQADEGHKVKENQDINTFYKENLDMNLSELANSSPDEY